MAVKNVTFEVTADTTKAQASLAALIKQLDDIKTKTTLKVSFDAADAKKELKSLVDDLKNTQKASIKVDTTDVKRSVEDVKKTVDSLPKEKKVKVEAATGNSTKQIGSLTNAVNFLTQAVANSSTNFTRLRNIVARTGVALGAVSLGAAVLSIGRAAIKAASDYEVLSVSFGTLIGNTELAKVKIQELRQFAAETPFTTEDVFQASRTLLGYGVAAGELIPTIKRLGDVAGGVGVPLERVALVFGQVRAAGRLYGQDLLQLVTLGFNPLAEISRTTGKSFATLKDEMRKGLITFDDVNKAFISATSEGGKFFNLTNALANTTQGRLARLKEEWTILLTSIGQGLQPAYESIIAFGRASIEFANNLPKFAKESSLAFTFLTAVTAGLTSALFANTLNIVANSAKTVFNTGVKIANGLASARQAIQTTLATRAITAQTIGQAALAGATSLATSAINAFKLAWSTNPLGLIITLLSTAAAAWYAFSDAVDTSQDGFLDAKEAINEITVRSQKESEAEIATLKQNFKIVNDTSKSLRERQAVLDKINKQYETSYKLTNDEKQNTIDTTAAQNDLTEAIKKTNKERVGGEVLAKAQVQITEITTDILNAASGLDIPLTPELLLDDEQIKGEFKNAEAVIQQQIDNLRESRKSFASTLFPGQTGTVNAARREFVTQEINQLDALIERLNALRQAYGVYSAIQSEIITPGTDTGTPDPNAAEKEKERIRRIKDYNKELSDLLNRIRKNNEDIRKQAIEFQFIDAANFEEEVEKLRLLDKIQEETVNREIDREIEAVRQKELTEQQKNKLIEQLEIIRGQEQQKRVFDLQQRIYKIERDGVAERRKIYFELQEIEREYYRDSLRFQLEKLDEFSQQASELIREALTPPDTTFDGLTVDFPIIARPQNFDFEDIVQPPIEAVEELRDQIASFRDDQTLFDSTQQSFAEVRIALIDEFNAKYGTTIAYVENELELQDELTKEYDKQAKALQGLSQEQKQINIFRLARQFQRGDITLLPFLEERKNETKDYLDTLATIYESDKKSIEDQRDFDVAQTGVSESEKVKIRGEAADKLKRLDDQFSKDKQDRLNSDADFEKNLLAQLRDFYIQDKEARIKAFEDIKDAFLDFQKVFIDGQIKQTDAAISAQERRVQAAKEIADKGNVVLLKAEQERLDKLNRQRANYVRQQQNLAAIEIAINSAIAIAKAAGQPGSPFTIFAILAAMAVGFAQARAQAQSAATFAKGGYTGDGHQFQEAGTVHKGEFVVNAQKTRQYRPLLEAIHAGRNPKALQSVQDRMFVVNSKSTDERLERIEKAIMGQKGLQLSIDEKGINGIVSRINYKNQRINNRAR